ncbi:thioesterase [marine bacterium AO1-C]|nr:thioesterase [marine bacterium AO1-C]
MNLEMNESAEARMVVQEADLASALPISEEDNFPEVFATSRMIALMELAAARLMQKALTEGQLSVGVGVNIKHLAATPKGKEVWAVATFTRMEGKLYMFTIEAFDEAGKIGEGSHSRAIIATERLLAGASKRFSK